MSEQFSFSAALDFLKNGYAITRSTWGGAKVYLVRGSFDFDSVDTTPASICHISENLFEHGDKGTVTRIPHLAYRPDGEGAPTINGWTPTIMDMLANDWSYAGPDPVPEKTEA